MNWKQRIWQAAPPVEGNEPTFGGMWQKQNAVIERTRDIGVLESLGASGSFIIRALLAESAALCIIGIAAGIGLSYAVRALSSPASPLF